MTEENTDSEQPVTFEVGDLVQFKSGGPILLVNRSNYKESWPVNSSKYYPIIDLIYAEWWIYNEKRVWNTPIPVSAIELVAKSDPVETFENGDLVSYKPGGVSGSVIYQKEDSGNGKYIWITSFDIYTPLTNGNGITPRYFGAYDYKFKKEKPKSDKDKPE